MSNVKCKLWFLHWIPHSTSGFPVKGLGLGLRDLLFSLAWGQSLYLPDPQSLPLSKKGLDSAATQVSPNVLETYDSAPVCLYSIFLNSPP